MSSFFRTLSDHDRFYAPSSSWEEEQVVTAEAYVCSRLGCGERISLIGMCRYNVKGILGDKHNGVPCNDLLTLFWTWQVLGETYQTDSEICGGVSVDTKKIGVKVGASGSTSTVEQRGTRNVKWFGVHTLDAKSSSGPFDHKWRCYCPACMCCVTSASIMNSIRIQIDGEARVFDDKHPEADGSSSCFAGCLLL